MIINNDKTSLVKRNMTVLEGRLSSIDDLRKAMRTEVKQMPSSECPRYRRGPGEEKPKAKTN